MSSAADRFSGIAATVRPSVCILARATLERCAVLVRMLVEELGQILGNQVEARVGSPRWKS
jgi:hypothetical protein